MSDVRYTAERLMQIGAACRQLPPPFAEFHADDVLRYGSAWQEEVRQLRERIAELSAELRRVESLAADAEKLRDWMTVDATCPCCLETDECLDDCTFETDCPRDYYRMSNVREVLKGLRHGR